MRQGFPSLTLDGAAQLVRHLKAAVAAEVGDCLRFSAGIGPNHLLAKIAGKLQKPDGFRWLAPENMPEAIAHLALDDRLFLHLDDDAAAELYLP